MSTTVAGYYKIIFNNDNDTDSFIPYYVIYNYDNNQVSMMYIDDLLLTPLAYKEKYKIGFKRIKCAYGGAYAVPYLIFDDKIVDKLLDSSSPDNCYNTKLDLNIGRNAEQLHTTDISNTKLDILLQYLTDKSAYILKNINNKELKYQNGTLNVKDTLFLDAQAISMAKYFTTSQDPSYKTYDYYLQRLKEYKQKMMMQQQAKQPQPTQPQPKQTQQQTQQQPQQQTQPIQSTQQTQSAQQQPQPTQPQPTQQQARQQPVQQQPTQQQNQVNDKLGNKTLSSLNSESSTTLIESYRSAKNIPNKEILPLTLSNIAKREFHVKEVKIPNLQLKEVL